MCTVQCANHSFWREKRKIEKSAQKGWRHLFETKTQQWQKNRKCFFLFLLFLFFTRRKESFFHRIVDEIRKYARAEYIAFVGTMKTF